MKITGFTAWLVQSDPGPKFIWRDGLPGSWSEIPLGKKPKKAVVRMETDSGLFGTFERHSTSRTRMALALRMKSSCSPLGNTGEHARKCSRG
jgi:hypothetical protein